MNKSKNYFKVSQCAVFMLALFGLFFALPCFAVGSTDTGTIEGLTTQMTTSFSSIGSLMFATAYLAGFALVITAIFKFKQHRDNPTQIPMGTPIALLAIGIILIFLPGIIKPAGSVIFGNNTSSSTGGFTGNVSNIVPGANGT